MNLNKLFSELVKNNPRTIQLLAIICLLAIGTMLGILKYDGSVEEGLLEESIFDFILWASIIITAVAFSASVAILTTLRKKKVRIGVDGDIKRSYSPVLEDLVFAFELAKKKGKILNVSVTNLGVQLKTQKKTEEFEKYIKTLDRGINDGEIYCKFLFLAYDKSSAERIIKEAEAFVNCESYEIKVIIDNYAPILPIYNIYTFDKYVGKLSIENPSNHIITIHSRFHDDEDSINRIQNTFNQSWSVDNAVFLLQGGKINRDTINLLKKLK